MISSNDELKRLRQLTFTRLLGVNAGMTPALRSLIWLLSYRGTTCGVRDSGRPRDFLPVATMLKEQPQYRRREIRPVIRVHIVADIRDFVEGPDRRMIEAVKLIGGLFLTIPDCEITFTVWGNKHPFPVQALRGESEWPRLGKLAASLGRATVFPDSPVGALRMRLATDEPAHIVLITNWITPSYIRDLPIPLGGTCFLVEPAEGFLGQGRTGAVDPVLSLLPSSAAEERDQQQRTELSRTCLSRRVDLVQLASKGQLLDHLEAALSGGQRC